MILSYERRFFFIANPKTASTSVEAYLRPYGKVLPKPREATDKRLDDWRKSRPLPKHVSFRKVRRIYGSKLATTFFSFAVVRDPVDWLLSFYFFRKRETIADPASFYHKNYVGDRGLDDYLLAVESGTLARPKSQLRRLLATHDEIGIKKILRFETLEEDLREVSLELDIPPREVPHRNPSSERKGFSRDDLTEDQYRRILALYRDDVIRLGYDARHPLVHQL